MDGLLRAPNDDAISSFSDYVVRSGDAPRLQLPVPMKVAHSKRKRAPSPIIDRDIKAGSTTLSGAFNLAHNDENVLRSRQSLQRNAATCFANAWEKSTALRYNSTLRVVVSGVEKDVDAALLPIDNEDKFFAIFSRMLGNSWNSIQTNKAAIRAWHSSHGFPWLFDKSTSEKIRLFWMGLRKSADHSSKNVKAPVSISEVSNFARYRMSSSTPAGLRDATMALIAFFGVRRMGEVINTARSEVTFCDDCAVVFIRKQKNDAVGKGMKCYIPTLSDLGNVCPVQTLRAWCNLWDKTWSPFFNDGPLFFVLRKAAPEHTTYCAFRQSLQKFFQSPKVGSHSLRKGGATWYRYTAKAPKELVQRQGGWRNEHTMDQCYALMTEHERRQCLIDAAVCAVKKSG